MPRVFLTEQQKLDARYERIRKCIGDRVVLSMHRNYTTQDILCKKLEMGHCTVRKLIDGGDVMMTTTKFLQILDFAGLALVDRRKDELEEKK